jgi:glycosyltransferase involved in cell wall biosynthesis
MKPKLLWCSESSFLSTGYAVYSREVLSRLHEADKLDITEFGAYGSNSDPRAGSIPWRFVGNLPQRGNKQEENAYNSNQINVFGAWKFEQLCLDIKPNIVFDNRDYWMSTFINNSPYRPYFHRSWMVACDAYPQAREWIDSYSECDSVFTYSDWAIDILKNQSGNSLNIITSTPGGAGPEFIPQDKAEVKKKFGLDSKKIIGFVARNQRRKLFPDLFESFRKFLDQTERTDVLLYLHTSYPDKNPWNLPELLNEYGLSSKVLLTYRCNDGGNNGGCGLTFPAFFSDYGIVCKRCKKIATTAGVQNGVDNNFLSLIYNLFDVYVQYANSEGLGIPQLEAAACGTPVMSVDYSAMSDVVRKVNGYPLKLKGLSREIETGCNRAIPDNDYLVEKLVEFFNMPEVMRIRKGRETKQGYDKYYGYDKAAQSFLDYFTSLDITELQSRWSKPARIKLPASQKQDNISNSDYCQWLISEVLGEPERLGSYMHARLLRDLNYGCTLGGLGQMYFNENSMIDFSQQISFDRNQAYEHFRSLAERRNYYEELRCKNA